MPPSFTATGAATLESGSIFSWELNDNLATGREISYDGLTSSNLTIESGAIFRVVLTGAATLGDTFWNAQRSWTDIFSVSGTTDGASVASLFDSFQIFNGSTNITNTVTQGSFSFNGSTLDWSPVPEPTTALAGVLLVAGLLRRSRQRVIRC